MSSALFVQPEWLLQYITRWSGGDGNLDLAIGMREHGVISQEFHRILVDHPEVLPAYNALGRRIIREKLDYQTAKTMTDTFVDGEFVIDVIVSRLNEEAAALWKRWSLFP